ncbi:hypothetical protein GOM49_09785 [Clostridium bovifaecis]|uniref:Uncharacterized protein n=1 Tax=Clostridium bovifaecis TaxID=2184719 RepID=A0A6I6F4N4_9CLOT|nr:hypothetical protein GOM49_09785 [Clostridium bovifaecis]
MLKIAPIELFMRLIPEMMIYMWGVHVVSKHPFNKKIYLCSSVILAVVIFFIRMLPIHFGVHMVINIIINIFISRLIGIPLLQAIYSTFFNTLLLSVSEFFNMLILNIFNINIDIVFSKPITKCLAGIPSLVVFSLLVLLIKFIFKKKEGINIVSN